MAGTTKRFNKDEVLQNALNVFWAKGYAATSMQDLVDAMSISRGSMYDTFGNKQTLFELAFNHYCQISIDQFKRELEKVDSPIGKLKKLLYSLVVSSLENHNNGCFANNIAIELGPHDKIYAKKIRDFWTELEKLFEKYLELAIQENEISSSISASDLSALLNTLMQGLITKSKVNMSQQQSKKSIDHFFDMLAKG